MFLIKTGGHIKHYLKGRSVNWIKWQFVHISKQDRINIKRNSFLQKLFKFVYLFLCDVPQDSILNIKNIDIDIYIKCKWSVLQIELINDLPFCTIWYKRFDSEQLLVMRN